MKSCFKKIIQGTSLIEVCIIIFIFGSIVLGSMALSLKGLRITHAALQKSSDIMQNEMP